MILVRCRCAVVLAVMLFLVAWLFPTSALASPHRHHGKKAAWFETLWPIASTKPVLGASRIVTGAPSDDIDDDFDDRETRNRPSSSFAAVDDRAELDIAAPPWVVRVQNDADPCAARLIVWRKLVAPRPPPSL